MSRPYWWFAGDSLAELQRQLSAGPVGRLEVHLDGKDMTFLVVPSEPAVLEGGGGPINDSHVCPPSCP